MGGKVGGRLFAGVLTAVAMSVAVTVPGAAVAATTPPDVWSSDAAGGGHTYANTGETAISSTSAAKLKAAWKTTNGSSFVAPAVVGGVAYHAINPGNANDQSTVVASSVRTGARLWSVSLPESEYYRGQSVSGGVAVLPFEGWHRLGGVTAVDLSTHKVLWSRSRPASTIDPGNDDGTGGPVAVDSGNAYLLAGNNDLTAYNLKTGALLWHLDPSAGVKAIAAGGGRLYTGGYPSGGGPGLVAYNGSTGKKEWTAPGLYGQPAVDGSVVLAPTYQGVGSVAAAGCAASTCKLTWSESFGAQPDSIVIGAATPTTFFVAFEPTSSDTGRLKRISTTTGTVQWTYRTPQPLGQVPIRAGNTVWVLTDIHTVKGWSVSTTASAALKTITLPSADDGVVGGIADAGGSLLVDIFAGDLTAYRIPGS